MANEFKAAAERKKKLTETRKAQQILGRMEELLKEQTLSPEDAASLQTAVDKLKEVTADASATSAMIMAENEEAQKLFDTVSEKLSKEQPEEEIPAEETKEEPEAEKEEIPSVPEEKPLPVQEAPAKQEVPAAAAEENGGEEKISKILRKMYSAPRHFRVGGEKKRRFSALISPSLIEKMEKDKEAGLIKSPNDLINGLLEIYYGDE